MIVKLDKVMERFGVSRQAVALWRKQGCPCRKKGRVWVYDLAKIETWLRGREMKTGRARNAKRDPGKQTRKSGKRSIGEKRGARKEASGKNRGGDREGSGRRSGRKDTKKRRERKVFRGEEKAGGLTSSIEQLHRVRKSVFKLAEKAIDDEEIVEANRLLATFKDLIETLRKASKDDIELRKMTRELIPKEEAESFSKLLCSTFKGGLYREVDEIADEVLTGLLGLEIGIKEKWHDPILVCVKDIVMEKFDVILLQLQRAFEERERNE